MKVKEKLDIVMVMMINGIEVYQVQRLLKKTINIGKPNIVDGPQPIKVGNFIDPKSKNALLVDVNIPNGINGIGRSFIHSVIFYYVVLTQ